MKLSEYLLDRIFSLICMLVAALVLLALLWLIETPAVFILFAEVILLAAYSTALLYDFFRKQSSHIMVKVFRKDKKFISAESCTYFTVALMTLYHCSGWWVKTSTLMSTGSLLSRMPVGLLSAICCNRDCKNFCCRADNVPSAFTGSITWKETRP